VAERSGRLSSLDGLRGLAAVVVVVFHVVISSPRQGAIYSSDGVMVATPLERVMHYSPLRVLWAGSEAVVVFYVLSGLVLSLPYARGAGAHWRSFYPQRLTRLYVPAIASLLFAWLTTLAVHRVVTPGMSPWLAEHATEPTGARQILVGSSLLGGWGGLNTSLWSLRWEVMFSVLLPLFVLAGIRFFPGARTKAALALAVAVLWPLSGLFYPDLVYASSFAVGVLMASRMRELGEFAKRLRPLVWVVVVVLGVTLLVNTWLVAGFAPHSHLRFVWIAIATVGAALLVFAAAFAPGARTALGRGPVHWLGTISFSLYLVQEPVVVGLAFVTGGSTPLAAQLVLGIACSVLVAWAFHHVVERPSHRLARALGRAALPADRSTSSGAPSPGMPTATA